MTIEKLLKEIALALEVAENKISETTTSADVDEWDSLGHIAILSRLDLVFENVSERVPELAEAMSVAEIITALKRDKQLL